MERYKTDLVILNKILWMCIINYEYSIYSPTTPLICSIFQLFKTLMLSNHNKL